MSQQQPEPQHRQYEPPAGPYPQQQYPPQYQQAWQGRPYQQQPRPLKDLTIAYACMIPSLLLVCGIQHFYLGKVGRGLLWLFTFGLFGVGLVIDLFTLPAQVKQINAQIAAGVR